MHNEIDDEKHLLLHCNSTAAEGPYFRGTLTVGTTFVHMARIVLRDL